jgi:TolB-like protein
MASVWEELKRRNVVKIAVAYAVVGWLLIEIISTVLPTLESPQWVLQTLTFVIIIGFPLALILSWVFDLTPEGLERTESAPVSDSVARVNGRKFYFVIIGLLALAVGFMILDNYVFRSSDPLEGLVDVSDPVPGFSNRAAIAVLPFLNLSDDPGQEYFSDGITEDVITGLQSTGSFPVIARTSTFSYKGRAMDVRDIAHALGAGYVLEGSVRKVANQVRITAQLNDATGRHVWAETYDSELHDIFSVQDEITHQILGAIEPELLQVEIDRAQLVRTEDMQAWDYYLQAHANATTLGGYADRNGRPVTIERTELARELAMKAVELDPAFADAYTLLGHISFAYVTALRPTVSEEASEKALQEAIGYARRGRELSPFSATTCSCYVYLLAWTGDPEAGLDIQEDAVRLNPANAQGRAVLAKLYQIVRRYDEALTEIQIAKRLSPRDADLSHYLSIEAATYLGLGDLESATNVATRAIELTPLNHDAQVTRIVSLYALGSRAEAVSAVDDMIGYIPILSLDMLWDEPLPEALIASVSPLMELNENTTYRQAVAAILADLGWNP